MVEAEAQGLGNIKYIWGLNYGIADTQTPHRVIKCALKGCQMLCLGGIYQRLLHVWERLVLHQLPQEQKLGQVFTQKIGDSLVVLLIPLPRLLLTILSQIYHHLPNVRGYQGALCALQIRVATGEVMEGDIVPVMKKFPIHG